MLSTSENLRVIRNRTNNISIVTLLRQNGGILKFQLLVFISREQGQIKTDKAAVFRKVSRTTFVIYLTQRKTIFGDRCEFSD